MLCRRVRSLGGAGWVVLGALAVAAIGGGSGFGCAGTTHDSTPPAKDGGGSSSGSGSGSSSSSSGGTGNMDGGAVPPPCPARGMGMSVFSAACTPGQPTVKWSPVRRISRVEYNNMVRDLIGDTTHPADQFVAESPLAIGVNFQANTCTGVGNSDTYIPQQYLQAAEALALTAVADPNLFDKYSLNPTCNVKDDACAQAFINAFAIRAFRGQFDSSEGMSLFANVYTPIRMQFDFTTGIQAVITSVLTSPRFLYVLEFGRLNATGMVVALSPYELATRLSLFLWRSLPDSVLLQAAASDQLSTPAQIKTQAVRMLGVKDPQFGHFLAQAALDDFTTQWLELQSAGAITRDSQYKLWTNNTNVSSELRGQTLATVHFTVLVDNGSLTDLLTSPSSYMNSAVKQFYVTDPSATTTLPSDSADISDPAIFIKTRLDSPSNPRAGILTDAIVLAAKSHTSFPSPTLRGKLVREQVLCDPIDPPPAGLNIPPPPTTVPANATIKDQYAAHEARGSPCAGCHEFMDKIGDAFAVYDATGHYQTTETDGNANADGGPYPTLDSSGQVVMFQPGEFTTSFTGPVDLVTQLAKATQVQQCFALQEFRYALARTETPADACSVQQIFQSFASSQLNIQELLFAVVQSDAFRYRTVVKPESACQ